MKILGNPLLSKNFMYSNLLLSEEGLFYKNVWSIDFTENIFLTDNQIVICDLLDLKYEDIALKTNIEIFKILSDCAYFRVHKFFVDSSNGKLDIFGDFADYLNKEFPNGIEYEYLPISLEKLDETFPGLIDKINESNKIKDCLPELGQKFKQSVDLIKNIENFDNRILSVIIPQFNNEFCEKVSRNTFLYYNTIEEISDKILSFKNN